MAELGITPYISFNSYSAGMSKSINMPIAIYAFIPPIQRGFASGLNITFGNPLVAFQVSPSFNFYSYSANIPPVIFGGLTLPLTPIGIGFNQSIAYFSFTEIASINLVDIFTLPLIGYPVGFNESLLFYSNNSKSDGISFIQIYQSFTAYAAIIPLEIIYRNKYYQFLAMSIKDIQIKSKVAITLDSSSEENVIELFDYAPYTKSGYRVLSENLEIQNLKMVSWISSTDAVDFPVFGVEDSESAQLLTALNLEWNSPRIQLDLVLKINDGNWQRLAAYSLLNSTPYPYREYDLGNHSLGDNAMIGLQIKNVGYGALSNTDKVTAYADLIRNVSLEEISDSGIKIANNITTIAATIVNANSNRKGITFFNNSTVTVYIDTSNAVTSSSHMIALTPGKYYDAPFPLYKGAYWGIVASDSTAIDIREFV